MVRVRVKGWGMQCINESPYKYSFTNMCASVCTHARVFVQVKDTVTGKWKHLNVGLSFPSVVMFLLNILTVADTFVNTIDHESENEVKASVKASSLFFQ